MFGLYTSQEVGNNGFEHYETSNYSQTRDGSGSSQLHVANTQMQYMVGAGALVMLACVISHRGSSNRYQRHIAEDAHARL